MAQGHIASKMIEMGPKCRLLFSPNLLTFTICTAFHVNLLFHHNMVDIFIGGPQKHGNCSY